MTSHRSVWELFGFLNLTSGVTTDIHSALQLQGPTAMRVWTDVSSLDSRLRVAMKKSRAAPSCFFYTPTYYIQLNLGANTAAADEFGEIAVFSLSPHGDAPHFSTRQARERIHPSIALNGPRWLHVPKTGGSFFVTAMQLGFLSQAHNPTPLHGNSMITLLREHRQHLVSWLFWDKKTRHCPELLDPDWLIAVSGSKVTPQNEARRKVFLRCFANILKGRRLAHLDGCQAKMVLGYRCNEPVEKVAEAIRAMEHTLDVPTTTAESADDPTIIANAAISVIKQRFKFVGSTDDFDASVLLAYQKLGRSRQMDAHTALTHINSAIDMLGVSTRESRRNLNPEATTAFLDYKHKHCDVLPDPHACDDPTDDMLFSHTQQAFLEDLVQFHDRPLRFIDTSLFAAFLGTPKDSAAMEFSNRKGGFYSNLTRILATQFDMPDSACVDLDHEDIDTAKPHTPEVQQQV